MTGRFEGMSLGTGMEAVQKAVAELGIPPAIRVVYGGIYAEQQKSFRDLVVVLALAVVLVFTVLLFEFGAFARADRRFWLRRCSRLRACFWRCWSRGPRSTFPRSWD